MRPGHLLAGRTRGTLLSPVPQSPRVPTGSLLPASAGCSAVKALTWEMLRKRPGPGEPWVSVGPRCSMATGQARGCGDQQPGPPSPAGPGLAGKALPLACAAASRAQRLSAGRAVLRAGRARHGCPAWVPVTQLTPEGRGEETGKKEERAGGRGLLQPLRWSSSIGCSQQQGPTKASAPCSLSVLRWRFKLN